MKKIVMLALSLAMATLFCAGSASAGGGIVERIRNDRMVHPLTGAVKIESVQVLWGDKEDPYQLRFLVELDRPGKVHTWWEHKGGDEFISKGTKVYRVDDYSYIYLVTLNTREVAKKTGSFGAAIELTIGTESLVGYPNNRKIEIHRKPGVPKEEWWHYFEATPLEIIVKGVDRERDQVFSTIPPTE